MVNLVDGDTLHTRAVTGIAAGAFDARRLLAGSVARYAIESRQPLLIEDTVGDHRINQELRAKLGDTSMICVPLFRDEEVIGTLNVLSCSDDERLNEDDRETLEVLSVVLTAAVSRVAEFEARRAQAQAIARFRTLFDGASIGIVRLDPEGAVVEVNPALEHMLGAAAEDLVGSSFTAHLVAEHRETVQERLAEMMAGGMWVLPARGPLHGPVGRAAVGAGTRVLEHREDGSPGWIMAMIENITERKRAEQS